VGVITERPTDLSDGGKNEAARGPNKETPFNPKFWKDGKTVARQKNQNPIGDETAHKIDTAKRRFKKCTFVNGIGKRASAMRTE